jgi:hypothetical protein
MAAEEPPSFWWHANDPLNVNNLSQGGQESFPSLADGIVATAAVLRQSNMRGIYDVLAADGPLSAFSAAVVASPWAASHYGGDPNHIANIPLPPEVPGPGTPPSPAPPIPPIPEEEMKPYYATNSAGTGFVIAADLSSKTGIPDGADAAALLATGQYLPIKLTDLMLSAIPNA